MFGFFRVAAVVPEMRVADVAYNTDRIIDLVREASKSSANAIVFPELSLTGSSCGDLFYQKRLLDWAERSLLKIALSVKDHNQVVIVGLPLRYQNALYDVAAVLQDGKVAGFVPKSVMNGSRECNGGRHFTSGAEIKNIMYSLNGQDVPVPFGTDLLFSAGPDFKFAIELGEDFWVPRPPSSLLAEAGARLIFNLAASQEVINKADFRINLLAAQSARCFSGYVYCSSGPQESTTSFVCGGHAVIAENGKIHTEGPRFIRNHSIIYADIDMEKLTSLRRLDGLFPDITTSEYRSVRLNALSSSPDLRFAHITPTPFVPETEDERDAACSEAFTIQASALAKRVEHVNAKRLIIGVSGGWDSTLALLVASQSMILLGRPASDIMAVTMPGFGTSSVTYDNTMELCRCLGTELVEIDIKEACLQHFTAIEHDPQEHNTLYENVQSRERTKILMSLANQEDGLVIGTCDMSESAIGWSTFNGDHMAMYNVNASVPKTLIPYMLEYFCRAGDEALAKVVDSIIDTPASPELLPPGEGGSIEQKTEDLIGPYQLHDFFLYHFVRYGATPEKIKYLAEQAFRNVFDSEKISKTLTIFLTRFFTQQYKRNCAPDGPRIGTISLSAHSAWLMPSDAASDCWLSTDAPSAGVRSNRNRTDWSEYSKRSE